MSESAIVPLFGADASAVDAPVNPDIVTHLENVLDAAKTGQMRGLAIVWITQGRTRRSWYCGEAHDLQGAAAKLLFDIMHDSTSHDGDD